jgi:hypothetical protein
MRLVSAGRSQGSSVSIVSDYGVDDRSFEVRSPAGAKNFSSSLCVQTGSGAHPASCTIGTGVLSPGVKGGRGVTLTTHVHLVPRSLICRSCTSSPHKRLHGRVLGQLYFVSADNKRGRSVTLTTHPHLVPRSRMSRSYIFSPPKRLHGV